MAEGIGIIGAGVAGLHLALYLQQHDIPVTVYSDQTAQQMASGRIRNTVAYHHHTTVARQQALGVDHYFNYPERQGDILATPERTDAFLARHGMG